ncbi:MAG: RNA polymerase sigma-54 factor, partial [Bacteroidetes bacterium]
MLKQSLQQKLQQKLSPQQIQLMKLLQVPAIALEQRIKEEMEANPVLEEGEEVEEFDENESSIEENDEQKDEMEQALEDFDYEEYTDDYIPEYKTRANNYSADDEDKSTPIVYYDSFLSGLEAQLGYLNLDENETQLAATLVGNLDDNGYLGRELESIVNDLAFTQGIETTYEELERILMLIQDFDPPGIGARDLNECLLIQLLKKDQDNPQIHLATKIIEKNFNAFAKKHYQKLIDKFEITEEELKEAIDEITKLNPKPGGSISGNKVSNQAIIPDFILTNNDGK